MFKKFNNKSLIIILAVLIAIFVLTRLFDKSERSFKESLVEVDSTKITSIIIRPPIPAKEIVLNRQGQNWMVESDGKSYDADNSVSSNLLVQLSSMKPTRVAATDQSKWKDFEVTDSTATRIKVLKGEKILSDMYIGRFSYQPRPQGQQNMMFSQTGGQMTSYVRLAGEDETYAVDGFLRMMFQKEVSYYRNKSLAKINRDDITRITFTYPGETFVVEKNGPAWQLDGASADSLNSVRYAGVFSQLTSTQFLEENVFKSAAPSHTIKIEGNNFQPVEIMAYPADTVNKFVVTSSSNQKSFFSGHQGGLFDRVFVPKSNFMAMSENLDVQKTKKK